MEPYRVLRQAKIYNIQLTHPPYQFPQVLAEKSA